MQLIGQKIVIVGAGSGIGLAIARMALAEGMEVIAVGRTRAKLEAIDSSVGARVRAVVADATREDEIERLFREVGPIDHVITTTADLKYEKVSAFDLSDVRRGIESKLVSSITLAKHARIAPHGSLLFTAGIASKRPMPGASCVASVNAALEGLARALAVELAPIRVNVLSPGWVDTPIWNRLAIDKTSAFATMAAKLPARRIGVPEDLAHAARFLMENGFTTGIVLDVDGGHRLV